MEDQAVLTEDSPIKNIDLFNQDKSKPPSKPQTPKSVKALSIKSGNKSTHPRHYPKNIKGQTNHWAAVVNHIDEYDKAIQKMEKMKSIDNQKN